MYGALSQLVATKKKKKKKAGGGKLVARQISSRFNPDKKSLGIRKNRLVCRGL